MRTTSMPPFCSMPAKPCCVRKGCPCLKRISLPLISYSCSAIASNVRDDLSRVCEVCFFQQHNLPTVTHQTRESANCRCARARGKHERLARLRRTDIRPWQILSRGDAQSAESRCHPTCCSC